MAGAIRRCEAALFAALALATPAHAHTAYNFDYDFGGTQIQVPEAVAVDPSDGEVFVADGGHIVVFDATGTPGRTFGQASGALAVSPLPPYDVYSADGSGRIQRYANDGTPRSSFAAAGVRGMAFDPQGNLYAADSGGVTRFAPDGSSPTTITTAPFTTLGATAAALLAANANTNLAEQLGFDGAPGQVFGAGQLDAPHAITADSDSNVFVADTGHNRVAIYNADGSQAASFGSRGAGEGQFRMLAGLAYSPVNQHVYAVDTVNANVTSWKPIPEPALGHNMDIQTDAGTVSYRVPGTTAFTKLTAVTRVPSGTIIDARHGTVGITSVTGSGQLQSADFYTGIFRAVQPRTASGLTEAQLLGGNFKACPPGLRAAKVPQRIRKLWGSGAGSFRTKGRFASASIRGTTWLTDDRCDGTLIRVTEGAVTVRDFVRKHTVIVRAGQQYFARARP